MSDTSFRAITPVTAGSNVASESVAFTLGSQYGSNRKIQLRMVTRHPLPELHFLAPFDHADPNCFEKLQSFVHAHLLSKARRGMDRELVEGIATQQIGFKMDDFEVPFDDPEILRDADTVEVFVDPEAATAESQQDDDTDGSEGMEEDEEGSDEDDDSEDQASDTSLALKARDAEERDAVLEATRVAALLRAGVHNADDDDAEFVSSRLFAADDLPRMPSTSAASLTKSISQMPTSPRSAVAPAFPTMPLPPSSSASGGGAAAALAAFEAKRKQIQASSSESVKRKATATERIVSLAHAVEQITNANKSDLGDHPSSSSSSSSSDGASDDSDSDSTSDSDSGSDSGNSSGSSGSSDSAPSEHQTRSDRHLNAANTHSAENSTSPVPPGQGTNRTKRRNQMRRKKLEHMRQSQSLQGFEEARERTAQSEGSDDVVERSLALVDDVQDDLAAVVNATPDADAGSSVQASSNGKKRKRNGDDAHDAQPEITGQFGGEIPAGMSVRHVDCNAYYDEQVAKLEAADGDDAQHGGSSDVGGEQSPQVEDGDASDAAARGGRRKRIKVEEEEVRFTPVAETEEEAPLAHDDNPLSEGESPLTASEEEEDAIWERRRHLNEGRRFGNPNSFDLAEMIASGKEIHPIWKDSYALLHLVCSLPIKLWFCDRPSADDTWFMIQTLAPPHLYAALEPEMFDFDGAIPLDYDDLERHRGVIFQQLALNPLTSSPELMWFVGVIAWNESNRDSLVAEIKGPLVEKPDSTWDDFTVEKAVWTKKTHPKPIWCID